MPLDPRLPPPDDPWSRVADTLANLDRRLRNMEAFMQAGVTSAIPVVATLPAAGRKGRLLFLSTDGKVYKDSGSAWVNPL